MNVQPPTPPGQPGGPEHSRRSSPPPGWYPDVRGVVRWWDGSTWTDRVQTGMPVGVVSSGPGAVLARPWFTKKRWWAVAAFVVIVGVAGAAGAGDDTTEPVANESPTAQADAEPVPNVTETPAPEPAVEETPAAEPTVEAAPAPAPTPEPEPEPQPELTLSQENAVQSAEDYLDYSAFSRKGLIEQLEFEDYSREDATFAVDTIEVDWKEQAAKSAEEYLSYTSFSRSGLIDQLVFEGFTRKQAEHGATQAGF